MRGLSIVQLIAGRYQIRLDQVVVMTHAILVRPIGARRTTRAVCGNGIVAALVSLKSIRRSDSQCRWFDPRRVNGAKDLAAESVLAIVSGGGDDQYSRIRQRPDRATQRVIFIRLLRAHTQTQINHPDVVRSEEHTSELKTTQHSRHRPLAETVQHSDVYHRSARSNTRVAGANS